VTAAAPYRPRIMQVTIVGQHVPHVPLLQRLLGNAFSVTGIAALPAQGPIETDVLITTRLSADEAPRLRCQLLQTPGAGLDAIALGAIPADCRVCNVFEHEIPIAEFVCHAVLDQAIFGDARLVPLDAAHWPRAYFERPFHDEAMGRRAAIVGFGAIGRATASRLRALGLHVTAVTRRASPAADADAVHPVADLVGLLPQVDVLVLCCPLDDATRGIIGARELAAMKPTAMLVNVGRAPLVQEQPLFDALQAGRIGRAVLDVWYHYPAAGQTELAPSALPLHTLPNARCTPHISGWTHGLLARRYAFMARNIEFLRSGHALQNVVQ
jgi:phosphoglycerate dehydrogenase-like enzyme